jgi:hypothetical protein
MIVIGVHVIAEILLPLVAHTSHGVGLNFGAAQRWQEHAGENGNDRDDHQQFDEGEGTSNMSRGAAQRFRAHLIREKLISRGQAIAK